MSITDIRLRIINHGKVKVRTVQKRPPTYGYGELIIAAVDKTVSFGDLTVPTTPEEVFQLLRLVREHNEEKGQKKTWWLW